MDRGRQEGRKEEKKRKKSEMIFESNPAEKNLKQH